MNQRKIILIAHNVRSTHNVGSLLRTADGLGLQHVYLTGYTPYPEEPNDSRLPHIRARAAKQINKTALGAENSVPWSHADDIKEVIKHLEKDGFLIIALEQTVKANSLPDFQSSQDIALILGNEVEGLDAHTLKLIHTHLQIPMLGTKESFNVANAAAMALYHFRHLA